jgi:hypothetical protein
VFLRSKVARGKTYYQIVRSERVGHAVSQRVMVALGRTPDPKVALEEMRRELAALRAAGTPLRRIERLEGRIGTLSLIVEKDIELGAGRVRSSRRERQSAYHEAGHAMMCLLLGRPIRCIHIVPDGFAEGSVMTWPRAVRRHRTWSRRLENDLAVACAGDAAESLEYGTPRVLSGDDDFGDRRAARRHLEGLRLGEAGLEAAFRRGIDIAASRLERPEVWVQVQALAARLMAERILAHGDAKRVCRQARRDYLRRTARGEH